MKDLRLTSLLSFIFLQLLSSFSPAYELWSLPIENELIILKVQNSQPQPQLFWLAGPAENQQTSYEVPASSSVDIPLFSYQNEPWLRLRADQKQTLQVQLQSLPQANVVLNSGSTNRWKVRTRSQNELILFNLAPFSQKIHIQSQSFYQDSVELAGFEKKKITLPRNAKNQLLSLAGDARFSGLLLTNAGPRSLVADSRPSLFPLKKNFRYYRLGNRSDTQSFVISLSDDSLIQQATRQIANPHSFQPRILIAQVNFGHGDFNRDFSAVLKAPWSWHVSEVYRFAEIASQECDGNPEFLEENLKPWVEGKGIICFWNYRILEELSPEQVSLGSK